VWGGGGGGGGAVRGDDNFNHLHVPIVIKS